MKVLQIDPNFFTKLLDKPEWLILSVCLLVLAYKVIPVYLDKKRETEKVKALEAKVAEHERKIAELEIREKICERMKGALMVMRKLLLENGYDNIPGLDDD